jgi:putative endonuclease
MSASPTTWRVEHSNTAREPGRYSRSGVGLLVYYESYQDVRDAIDREKALKKWRRAWKIQLIETNNPQWRDLYEGL